MGCAALGDSSLHSGCLESGPDPDPGGSLKRRCSGQAARGPLGRLGGSFLLSLCDPPVLLLLSGRPFLSPQYTIIRDDLAVRVSLLCLSLVV